MALSGYPAPLPSFTSEADLETATVVNPAPSVRNVGDVVTDIMRELADPAFIVFDPINSRLYATTDPDTRYALDMQLQNAYTGRISLKPDSGQTGRVLTWSEDTEETFSKTAETNLATEPQKVARSVSALINFIYGRIRAAHPTFVLPFCAVDQTTGEVWFYEPEDSIACANGLAEIVPSGKCVGVRLLPFYDRDGASHIFENGGT